MAKFRIEDITPPRKRVGNKRIVPPELEGKVAEPDESVPHVDHELYEAHVVPTKAPASSRQAKRTPAKATHGDLPRNTETLVQEGVDKEPAESRGKILTGAERFKSFFDSAPNEVVDESEVKHFPETEKEPEPHYAYSDDDRDPNRYDNDERGRLDFGKWLPWLVGAAVVIIGGVVLTDTVFSHATITITPKSEVVSIPNTITAHKDPEAGMLGFAMMKVELSDTREIPATGSKQVSTKASGKIVIYNNYSTGR